MGKYPSYVLSILSFISVMGFSAQGFAQDTPWQSHDGVLETRIVAASHDVSEDGAPVLAWHARLAPGWKTYWRSPGEAGLPVRLFEGDKEIEIEYPLPERFTLFGIDTYGYSDEVYMPFELASLSDGAASVKADFMVCKDICIPFRAEYSVEMDDVEAAGPAQDIAIKAWRSKVPVRDEAQGMGLEIMSARVVGSQGRQRLIVDVSADGPLDNVDMLVEGAPGTHFEKPEVRLMEDGTKARLVIKAHGGRGRVDFRGETVRITYTDGNGKAIDRMVTVKG